MHSKLSLLAQKKKKKRNKQTNEQKTRVDIQTPENYEFSVGLGRTLGLLGGWGVGLSLSRGRAVLTNAGLAEAAQGCVEELPLLDGGP